MTGRQAGVNPLPVFITPDKLCGGGDVAKYFAKQLTYTLLLRIKAGGLISVIRSLTCPWVRVKSLADCPSYDVLLAFEEDMKK